MHKAYNVVTTYCMYFLTFLCVTLKLSFTLHNIINNDDDGIVSAIPPIATDVSVRGLSVSMYVCHSRAFC